MRRQVTLRELRRPHHLAEPAPPLVRRKRANHEPLAVPGLKVVPGRAALRVVEAPGGRSGPHGARDAERLQRQLRAEQRGVHLLRLARAIAVVERQQDGVPGDERAHLVRLGEPGHRRRALLALPGHGHEPTPCLRERIHRPAVGVRAKVPPPRGVREDAAGVHRLNAVERDPETLQGPVPQVVVHHVRGLHQPPEDRLAGLRLQIEGE